MGLKKTLLDNYYKCDECGCFFLAQVGEDMLIHDESSILDCPYCSNVREKTKEIEELKKDAMTLHTRINSEIDENGENAGFLVELQKEHEELQELFEADRGTLLESTVEDFEYDKTHALADKVEELNNRLKMLERPGGCDALDIANESTEKIQALDSHVDDLRKEMNFLAIDAETFRNSIVSLQESNEALATLPPVDIGARKQHRHTRDALQGLLIVLKEGFLRSPRTRESKMAHDIQAALQTLIAQEKGEQS